MDHLLRGWRVAGPDPRHVVAVHRYAMPTETYADAWRSLANLAIPVGFGIVTALSPGDGVPTAWVIGVVAFGVALVLTNAALLFRRAFTRIEVGPTGLTIANVFRTTRCRWGAVTGFAVEGRQGVTVLTRDGDVVCDALRATWNRWPRGEVSPEALNAMTNAVSWLEATRIHYAVEATAPGRVAREPRG